VRHLVLDYDLHIIPILMKFEPHARIEFPLESVDSQAVAKWLDDRILDFVRTYLSLHENEYYLKPQMVTDPIAGIEFPQSAAGATLERDGKAYYFISEETRGEFEKRQGAEKGAAAGSKAKPPEKAPAASAPRAKVPDKSSARAQVKA
jgi:YHS domain-containing protein